MDLIPITPRNGETGRRSKYVAPFSIETELFDDAQRDVLIFWYIAKACFHVRILRDQLQNARWPKKFCVLRVANTHLPVSAFL